MRVKFENISRQGWLIEWNSVEFINPADIQASTVMFFIICIAISLFCDQIALNYLRL